MFAAMDQTLPGDMPITLVIKAPNQRMADQTVDCMLGWTIRKLKQHLELVYPSKPKHNEQRLIYSGKLLQDHLTLKEILRQYEDSDQPARHTVHLVCSRSSECSSTTASSSATAEQRKSPSPGHTSASPSTSESSRDQPSVSQQQNQAGDGLRYRGTASHSLPQTSAGSGFPHTGFLPQSGAVNSFGTYPAAYTAYAGTSPSPAGYSPDQYALLMQQQQQAYSQYMMQYMQYYQSMYYPGQNFSPQMVTSPAMPMEQPEQQAQQQQQQQPAAAQPRPDNDGNNMPRMNAQGGVDQDDDNDLEPRDWLHHVYFLMRFLTFMGFLCFYSSPTRFLLVSSGSIAIYFLQKIRQHMQRIQQAQEQERNQLEEERQRQQAEQQQQQEQNGAPAEDHGAGGANNTENNRPRDERAQVQEPAAAHNRETQASPAAGGVAAQAELRPGEGHWVTRAVVFVCMTIQAFFTSLLPTPPELLDAN